MKAPKNLAKDCWLSIGNKSIQIILTYQHSQTNKCKNEIVWEIFLFYEMQ